MRCASLLGSEVREAHQVMVMVQESLWFSADCSFTATV